MITVEWIPIAVAMESGTPGVESERAADSGQRTAPPSLLPYEEKDRVPAGGPATPSLLFKARHNERFSSSNSGTARSDGRKVDCLAVCAGQTRYPK